MLNLKKTFLPGEILHAGRIYKLDQNLTFYSKENTTFFKFSLKNFKAAKIKIIRLSVLAKNLKGLTDLHGKFYQPSVWYFSTK